MDRNRVPVRLTIHSCPLLVSAWLVNTWQERGGRLQSSIVIGRSSENTASIIDRIEERRVLVVEERPVVLEKLHSGWRQLSQAVFVPKRLIGIVRVVQENSSRSMTKHLIRKLWFNKSRIFNIWLGLETSYHEKLNQARFTLSDGTGGVSCNQECQD